MRLQPAAKRKDNTRTTNTPTATQPTAGQEDRGVIAGCNVSPHRFVRNITAASNAASPSEWTPMRYADEISRFMASMAKGPMSMNHEDEDEDDDKDDDEDDDKDDNEDDDE